MFTRGLAIEGKRDGIRANVLTPSIIEGTATYDKVMSDEFSGKLFGKAIKMAQLGVVEADDLAALIVFLAGPQAAKLTVRLSASTAAFRSPDQDQPSERRAVKRLEGRRAIITGAGSGIGRASALRFASEGAHVLVVGRTRESLAETVDLVRAAGGIAEYFVADATRESDVAAAVAFCLEKFAGLEICFANAGNTDSMVPLFEQTVESWETQYRDNVISAFLAVKHAGRHMVPRGVGSIILNSSTGSLRANGGTLAYSVAKAGVNSLTMGAAASFAGTGVRVNAVLRA